VTEPYSAWPKFPHTRFFVHYASGCTMLESFAQSLASPLQTLLMGDPLARPYGSVLPLTLICVTNNDEAITGSVEFMVTQPNGVAPQGVFVLYLLDGKSCVDAGRGTRARIDTRKLDDGWHEMRAIAYSGGNVRQQSFSIKRFGVRNKGRSIEIKSSIKSRLDVAVPLDVKLEATGGAERFEFHAQGRVMASSTNATFPVDLAGIGPGPVWLQSVAYYADGSAVRSRPQVVDIKKTSK